VFFSGQTFIYSMRYCTEGFRFFGLPSLESKMVIVAKSGVKTLLLMIAASTAVFAQSSGPNTPQNHASVADARQVVLPSVLATERSWAMRDHYTYMERDEDRRLNSLGQVKSETVDVTRMMVVNGARFEQLLEHSGQLPSAKEQKRSDDDLDKLKHETPEERAARLRKDQENRAFLRDVLEAFDFRLVGEEIVVVFDETELSEFVHEEVNARARGAHHFRQRLLGDLRQDALRLFLFSVARKYAPATFHSN